MSIPVWLFVVVVVAALLVGGLIACYVINRVLGAVLAGRLR